MKSDSYSDGYVGMGALPDAEKYGDVGSNNWEYSHTDRKFQAPKSGKAGAWQYRWDNRV